MHCTACHRPGLALAGATGLCWRCYGALRRHRPRQRTSYRAMRRVLLELDRPRPIRDIQARTGYSLSYVDHTLQALRRDGRIHCDRSVTPPTWRIR